MSEARLDEPVFFPDEAAIAEGLAAYAQQLRSDEAARFRALRECSFFAPVPDDSLRRIAAQADISIFHSDLCLTTQDEETQRFYVILRGSADAYRNGKRAGAIDSGECIGEAIFFAEGAPLSSATVVADYRIIAATLDREAVAALREDAALMVALDKALLLALFRKLQNANRRIEELSAAAGR